MNKITIFFLLSALTAIVSLFLAATYADEVIEFKKNNPKNFSIQEYKPFIITGNIKAGQMNRIVHSTIKRCATALYNDFFEDKPDYLIKIYLFKDNKSYRYYSKKLFDIKPETPFGYYLSGTNSLVMNIATGSGTLVHELVHALIDYDFPDIPAWFDEGMGSLFEACSCGKHIYGLLNWRLPILQKGLKANKLLPLKELLATSSDEFYEDEKNMNYGEARYFCLYMQEKKVLKKFYRLFRDNFDKDPSGLYFVEKVFNEKIDSIEKKWLKWVKKLRYER